MQKIWVLTLSEALIASDSLYVYSPPRLKV